MPMSVVMTIGRGPVAAAEGGTSDVLLGEVAPHAAATIPTATSEARRRSAGVMPRRLARARYGTVTWRQPLRAGRGGRRGEPTACGSPRGDGPAVEPDPLAEEQAGHRVPRKQDLHAETHRQAAGRDARPLTGVGARELGGLEHALRADDDLGQREAVVRKRGEQLGVERPCAGVPLPLLAG